MNEQNTDKVIGIVLSMIILGLIAGVITLWMWGMPKYRIYKQDRQGYANLRQQEWEKKIAIEAAKAANESATLQAEAKVKLETANAAAEVVRARGVAEANEIIADSLRGNEAYLRYLWINKVAGGNEVIYVPTEAGIPILEAGNRTR